MSLRIAVGGFLHESHSFAPQPTSWAEFVQPGGLPPLRSGSAMLDAVRGRFGHGAITIGSVPARRD